MIFLDVVQPDFTAVITSLIKEHYPLAILAVILIILSKYAGDIGLFFKEYFNAKQASEAKRLEEIGKTSDRHMVICEDMTKAVNNNSLALGSLEKAFVTTITGSEGRTSERITGIETRLSDKISGVETRLSDKIAASTKDVLHGTKLDKIASTLGNNHGDTS